MINSAGFRRRVLTLLVFLATSLDVSAAPRAAPSEMTAILPPRGSKDLTDRLSRGPWSDTSLAPTATRRKLLARSDISRALGAAKDALVGGEKAALHMKREAALAQARRALVLLQSVHARHFEAALVARAHLLMGRARLLHPPEPDAAMRAFSQVFSTDRRYRIDLASFPSRVSTMLSKARSSASLSRQPLTKEMNTLASWLGVRRLAWVRLRPATKAKVKAEVVVYDHAKGRLTRTDEEIPDEGGARDALNTAIRSLVLGAEKGLALDTEPATKPAQPVTVAKEPITPASRALIPRAAAPTAGEPAPTRWYGRWWVWTLAGAVVAGSAVAITLAATAEDTRSYSLKFTR